MRRSLMPISPVFALLCVFATIALAFEPRVTEGAMITYISATRYVEGNGIPREDAVGFNDFDVSRGVTIGPDVLNSIVRVEAAQTSRLLSDRIEVSASTLTQYLQGGIGNSISADSIFSIVFSVNEATQVTLTTGPIFSQSNGGIASAALLRNSDQSPILVATEQGSPMSAMLTPGEYKFVGAARSGSLQRAAGPAQAVATLTIPPVSSLAAMGVGAMLAGARRTLRSPS